VSGWKAAVKGLEDSIVLAQHLFDQTRETCRKRAEQHNAELPYFPPQTAEDQTDNNGRPLLLEAALSLATARAALVTALAQKR
jgi:hypothetical protein